MPGFAHETIASLFKGLVDKQSFAMGLFDEFVLRTSLLAILGNWTKEPGTSWAPQKTDKLSVILEMGASTTNNG